MAGNCRNGTTLGDCTAGDRFEDAVRTRLNRLVVLARRCVRGGMRGGPSVPAGRRRDEGRRPRSGRRVLPDGGRRPIPDNPNYKIALERAMLAASRAHLDRAKAFEDQDQLEAARGEYRLAAEYDPSNRQAAAKVAALEQTIRDAHRGGAAAAGDRAAARARARGVGRAAAQPGVARAAPPDVPQRQRPRHPERHRQRDRHQHHLRPQVPQTGRRPCSSTASRSSRRSSRS